MLPLIRCFLKWTTWVIGVLVVLILYIFLSSLHVDYFWYNKLRLTKPFDSVAWKKVIWKEGIIEVLNQDEYTRCYMYRDLVKNHLHLNMTYKKVVELLGDLSDGWTEYYADPELKTKKYFLGYCTSNSIEILGFGPNLNALVLYFDRNKKLVAFSRTYGANEKKDIQQNQNISIENSKPIITCNYKINKCFYEDPKVGSKSEYKMW